MRYRNMVYSLPVLVVLVLFLVGLVQSEDAVTVTETNYITPSCFADSLKTMLVGEIQSGETGIPIVFVYPDAASEDQGSSSGSDSSYNGHTMVTSVVSGHFSGSDATGTYDAQETAFVNITETAYTTTTTIYEATETPSSIYEGTTTYQTLTRTMSDPLVTKSVVSKSIENSITASITGAVTISSASSTSNSTIASSNATTLGVYGTAAAAAAALSSTLITAKFSNTTATLAAAGSDSNVTAVESSAATISGQTSINGSAITTLSASIVGSSSASSQASSSGVLSAVVNSASATGYSGDLFEAVDTSSPPSVFPREELPLDVPSGTDNGDDPYQTNKFYVNLFLSEQTDTIWSYPYALIWKTETYYGLGFNHINASDRVFGSVDTNNDGVDSYYYNPIGNSELIFSSTSFSSSANYLSVGSMKSMSVVAKLSANESDSTNYIEVPIVQGMGFVTSIYHGDLVPLLNTLEGVETLTKEESTALSSNVSKYRATLFTGVEWLIYVTLPDDSTDFELEADGSYKIQGTQAVDGLIIQAAVAPESSQDVYYDSSAGMYATEAVVSGSVSGGTSAEYKFTYSTEGSCSSDKLIVFALPHHVESLTDSTSSASTGIKLLSSTKGDMVGYLTNELAMSETLETSIQFLPWTLTMTSDLSYTAEQLELIVEAANSELSVDIASTVSSMDSNYYSGKVIDKYAYILLVLSDIIQDENATASTLEDMKDAFDTFVNNEQYYPLMYDTKYKGVTSTASQSGDTGADFGSGYYNDHHFHYGYFIHAAAVVGYVDKKLGGDWAEENKDWVNALIRDVANPSEDDTYFPVSRMFDWFAGHSWAGGLFTSGDGRNEESSSEDYNFAYGMKLWGNVIGDNSMESRGDLMLAVMSRAMNKYFYYTSNNTVEPLEILPNKVSGIIFDNKITYSTYFGTPADHPEYVHGIHMLPITPASSLIRIPEYVEEEWQDQISGFIDDVDSGWTGILRLNQALFDASTSYDFFSSDSWSSTYLDNGQSRTWGLAFSAGISNAT